MGVSLPTGREAELSPAPQGPRFSAGADGAVCFCFSEQCIEAYELLLALAESEQSLILGQFRAAGVGSSPGKCGRVPLAPARRPPASFGLLPPISALARLPTT